MRMGLSRQTVNPKSVFCPEPLFPGARNQFFQPFTSNPSFKKLFQSISGLGEVATIAHAMLRMGLGWVGWCRRAGFGLGWVIGKVRHRTGFGAVSVKSVQDLQGL